MQRRWNALVEALKNFTTRARHYQARHPIVYAMGGGALTAVVWTLVTLSYAPFTYSITGGLGYGAIYTVIQLYFWRPGGKGRRRYEEWCEREKGVTRPIVFPGGSPAPGWYQNPERHNRVRFWNGAQWV